MCSSSTPTYSSSLSNMSGSLVGSKSGSFAVVSVGSGMFFVASGASILCFLGSGPLAYVVDSLG